MINASLIERRVQDLAALVMPLLIVLTVREKAWLRWQQVRPNQKRAAVVLPYPFCCYLVQSGSLEIQPSPFACRRFILPLYGSLSLLHPRDAVAATRTAIGGMSCR
jgi:hypothetical protein